MRIMSTNKSKIPLKSMWFNPKHPEDIKSPVISFSCEIAKYLQNSLDFDGRSSPNNPLWHNSLFTVQGKSLERKGISSLIDLFSDGNVTSFQV